MPSCTHLSAYMFTPLTALPALRLTLQHAASAGGLKGTVLLSAEGINLFVAGEPAAAAAFVAVLRTVPGLEELTPRETASIAQPYRRMLVKIKREIIAFGIDGIDPARRPSPRISPRELKQWLDAGRPVVLLDTRNTYEVAAGTFHGARHLGLGRFRDLPAAVAKLPIALRSQPIVTFCTGGIRCEKAAPLLQQEGFREVYQLDGGILNYFEACGAAHFDGECFVFDERVAIAGGRRESRPETPAAHACA